MIEETIKKAQDRKAEDIKKAQDRKRYEIGKFANARTLEMIKFAAWRTAEGLTTLEIETEGIDTSVVSTKAEWWSRFRKNLAEAEKRLKEYILGVPF